MALIAAFTALCVLVAGAAFAAGRWFDDSGGPAVRAVQEPTPSSTNRAIVTIDGYTIDTSNSNWMDAFRDAEARKPRYDQVINGIAIGPTVAEERLAAGCTRGDVLAPEDAAKMPRLALNPKYMPEPIEFSEAQVGGCGQFPIGYFEHYWLPPDEQAHEQIVSVEASWFEVRHGSILHLIRRVQMSPHLVDSSIPAERWEAATIAGRPAAVAHPMIGSFGQGMVLVWDAEADVLTQVGGEHLSLDELIRIAEGLF